MKKKVINLAVLLSISAIFVFNVSVISDHDSNPILKWDFISKVLAQSNSGSGSGSGIDWGCTTTNLGSETTYGCDNGIFSKCYPGSVITRIYYDEYCNYLYDIVQDYTYMSNC